MCIVRSTGSVIQIDVAFKEKNVMSESRPRIARNPKKTFDLIEYLIIKVVLIVLLGLGGLGLIWHAVKLFWSAL